MHKDIIKKYIQKDGSLPPHRPYKENSLEELYNFYYDFPKHECEICNDDTKFIGFRDGYDNVCGRSCRLKHKKVDYSNIEEASIEDTKEFVINILIGNKVQGTRFFDTYFIKNNYQSFHKTLMKHMSIINVQNLYDFCYDIKYCPICNSKTKFNGFMYGYQDLCSDKCNKTTHIKNSELLNKEYILEKFVSKNRLDIQSIIEFFNVSESFVNKFKEKNDIKFTNKYVKTKKQDEVFDFINIPEKQLNNRSVINGELDIYCPKEKFAIEFDGIMYHSFGMNSSSKFNNYHLEDKNIHLNKTLQCEERDIQLFRIFENEWKNPIQQKIWKSVINSKIGTTNKIFARSCEIKLVDIPTSRKFLTENHLQGNINSNLKIGLYFESELVSLMTFGKSRFNKKYEWELLRFASKLNTTIVGGGSRILKYFERNYQPKSLVSYANRRWSTGNFYEKVGFNFVKDTSPNYFYFKPNENILFSRIKFQKSKLEKILDIFDNEETESINMYKNGYRKIYDCGNKEYYKEY